MILISYGIKEFDGRLNEIIKSIEKNYTLKMICLTNGNVDQCDNHEYIYVNKRKYLSMKLYLEFFIKSIINIYKIGNKKKERLIFIDNFYAAPVGFVAKILFRRVKIVQDCRELYFSEDMPKLGKVFCLFEKMLLKKSVLVFCANKYRSQIMKEKFQLDFFPEVYDNIRLLEYHPETDMDFLEKKYQSFFQYEWNIISTGGFSILRKTDILIQNFKNIDNLNIGLYIAGTGSNKDKQILNSFIEENNIDNVHFIGRVDMNELKFVVSKCDIGIVSYHQNDLNNEFCSSGKIYEYMGEGLPVVTTENTPLKILCDENMIGISDNNFTDGIIGVIKDYVFYKKNVKSFMSDFSVEENNIDMANKIKEAIEN